MVMGWRVAYIDTKDFPKGFQRTQPPQPFNFLNAVGGGLMPKILTKIKKKTEKLNERNFFFLLKFFSPPSSYHICIHKRRHKYKSKRKYLKTQVKKPKKGTKDEEYEEDKSAK